MEISRAFSVLTDESGREKIACYHATETQIMYGS